MSKYYIHSTQYRIAQEDMYNRYERRTTSDVFFAASEGISAYQQHLSHLIQRPVSKSDLMSSVGTTNYIDAGFSQPSKPFIVAARITKSDSGNPLVSLKDFIALSANAALLEIRAACIESAQKMGVRGPNKELTLYPVKAHNTDASMKFSPRVLEFS